MARRGGVKRITAGIYDEIRQVMKRKLEEVSDLSVVCACSCITFIDPQGLLRD